MKSIGNGGFIFVYIIYIFTNTYLNCIQHISSCLCSSTEVTLKSKQPPAVVAPPRCLHAQSAPQVTKLQHFPNNLQLKPYQYKYIYLYVIHFVPLELLMETNFNISYKFSTQPQVAYKRSSSSPNKTQCNNSLLFIYGNSAEYTDHAASTAALVASILIIALYT